MVQVNISCLTGCFANQIDLQMLLEEVNLCAIQMNWNCYPDQSKTNTLVMTFSTLVSAKQGAEWVVRCHRGCLLYLETAQVAYAYTTEINTL